MAPVKLTYFPVQGVAEVSRLLMKYGDIEFEDVRLSLEQFANLKSNLPFGQIPVYEEAGQVYNQSVAIARYLAKKVNLVGNSDLENLEIDGIADTLSDIKFKIVAIVEALDEKVRNPLLAKLKKETVPYYFDRLDKIVKKNNGYLAVGRLTWADIYFFSLAHSYSYVLGDDAFVPYPSLTVLLKKVGEIPKIKAWVETRPKEHRKLGVLL